jgi:hypothetical protein
VHTAGCADLPRPALPLGRDRRGGRDHIWLVTHDEASCYVPAAIRPSIILSHWGRLDANHTSGSGCAGGGCHGLGVLAANTRWFFPCNIPPLRFLLEMTLTPTLLHCCSPHHAPLQVLGGRLLARAAACARALGSPGGPWLLCQGPRAGRCIAADTHQRGLRQQPLLAPSPSSADAPCLSDDSLLHCYSVFSRRHAVGA